LNRLFATDSSSSLPDEDLGGDIGITAGQIPRVADESLLLNGQDRVVQTSNIVGERSVGGHDAHDVIEGLLPGSLGLVAHLNLLAGNFQEQAGGFLHFNNNLLVIIAI